METWIQRLDLKGIWSFIYVLFIQYTFSLLRFDGFEQGLNNFHIQAKSVAGSENLRRSPPYKKTKKASKDLVLESPKAFKDNKFGESADKFLFLGELKVSWHWMCLYLHQNYSERTVRKYFYSLKIKSYFIYRESLQQSFSVWWRS